MSLNKTSRDLKIGVVGATGLVGEEFLSLIEKRDFKFSQLKLFASDKSVGQVKTVQGQSYPVEGLKQGVFDGLNLVFFSSGDEVSREWAPQAVRSGAFAVDNSGAFRMEDQIPLIVPEVNGHVLPPRQKPLLIANPNCSTIQLVMALAPLKQDFGLEGVRVATYQAVSGAGRGGREELLRQTEAFRHSGPRVPSAEALRPEIFPHPIAYNCIPQVGSFFADGFCSEERKIRLETRKILDLPHLSITAWTVRVPVLNAHCEAAWVTLNKVVSREDVLASLRSTPGVVVVESQEQYTLAQQSSGTDPVYVGRVHQDPDDPQTWLMWIVSDNLRKGAALNGLQIAEKIFS